MLENEKWRFGPAFPTEYWHGVLIEHPSGNGVIAAGGRASGAPISNLYFLKDGGLTSTWQLLPQTIKHPTMEHIAMLLPDKMANCTLV